jgi:hypothetical protein
MILKMTQPMAMQMPTVAADNVMLTGFGCNGDVVAKVTEVFHSLFLCRLLPAVIPLVFISERKKKKKM